jgi:hypothetical protein
MGMKIEPVGEVETQSNMESGVVVSQNPYPGVLMKEDGANPPQIEVYLSKRV